MDENKWLNTISVYGEYEKQFARAACERTFYMPSNAEDKNRIISDVKKLLAYREEGENFKCEKSMHALNLCGTNGHELQNISIANSTIRSEKSPQIACANISMENVKFLQNFD